MQNTVEEPNGYFYSVYKLVGEETFVLICFITDLPVILKNSCRKSVDFHWVIMTGKWQVYRRLEYHIPPISFFERAGLSKHRTSEGDSLISLGKICEGWCPKRDNQWSHSFIVNSVMHFYESRIYSIVSPWNYEEKLEFVLFS